MIPTFIENVKSANHILCTSQIIYPTAIFSDNKVIASIIQKLENRFATQILVVHKTESRM